MSASNPKSWELYRNRRRLGVRGCAGPPKKVPDPLTAPPGMGYFFASYLVPRATRILIGTCILTRSGKVTKPILGEAEVRVLPEFQTGPLKPPEKNRKWQKLERNPDKN